MGCMCLYVENGAMLLVGYFFNVMNERTSFTSHASAFENSEVVISL